ncbi:MAG TPA: chromate efflux transporter [Actinomycetota bacterium]|nr:chromate efflux transporter [Actinomycetota bacterium]
MVTIALEWGRIGITGFGGPPAHIALLRSLCVERRGWLSAQEFEDGIAATGLLPGPASTQLAIYCAWRLRGPAGALVGGICFIVPGLVVILALASLFLAAHPPRLIEGAAAGAGAAVPAVAVQAALGLLPASRRRAWEDVPGRAAGGGARARRLRWLCYLAAGGAAGALAGPLLVVVLAASGLVEAAVRAGGPRPARRPGRGVPALVGISGPAAGLAGGGVLALAWVAFKVGALSYGGGFVIIPLMQHDAVAAYHWMTTSQFLGAVALGQITPGPVVLTVAAVGYAAAGVGGGLFATLIAFTPSFVFVMFGGPRFGRLRRSATVQAFLAGAGPAAVGAIAGASVPLARGLAHLWQLGLLALACLWLLVARRGVVPALALAGALGALAALAGAPVSR